MKKLLPLILLLSSTVFVTAQDVSETSMPLISKKTATWCGPCGTWGWELFKTVVDQNSDNAIIIELHQSSTSKLNSSIASALYREFDQVSSTPAFYVGTTNMTQYAENGGIYTTSTGVRVKERADSMATAVDVNSGFDARIENDKIMLDAKVKFFAEATGEYYIGAYVTEREVLAYQNGIGNDAVHHNVLRASMTSAPFGEKITEGTTSSETEFDFDFSIDVDASWKKDDLRVFTAIWKKEEDGSHTFQSGYTEFITGTGIDRKLISKQFDVYPSVLTQGEQITVSAKNHNSDIKISFINLMGQEIVSQYFDGKQNQVLLDTHSLPGKGNYLLVIESQEGIHKNIILVK